MRIRSWIFLGIGYLAGTRAGRERFEELKDSVQQLADSEAVAGLLERARESLGLPGADGARDDSDDEYAEDEDDEYDEDEDDEDDDGDDADGEVEYDEDEDEE